MLDLVIRARDIHQISSLYVTKELHEIPYLADHHAVTGDSGEITIRNVRVASGDQPASVDANRVDVIVLEKGRAVFSGTPAEFESSDLPAVTRLTQPGFQCALD